MDGVAAVRLAVFRARILALIACVLYIASATAATPRVDYEAMTRAAVDRVVAGQSARGFFYYGFNFLTDEPIEPNRLTRAQLVRQAGTALVLAKYYARFKDARVSASLQRSFAGYASLSVPIGKGVVQNVLEDAGVMSIPIGRWKLQAALDKLGWLYTREGNGRLLSHDGTYASAVASGAALALAAELVYSRASGDEQFAPLRSSWLDGLLAVHLPAGGFRQTPVSMDDDDHYLNAHAWYALAMYVERTADDERVNHVLRDVDETLMSRYSQHPHREFYHWGAIAASQRFKTTRDPRFLDFLRQQAQFFFNELEPRLNAQDNPCATMEGLAATLSALRSGNDASPIALRIAGWLRTQRDKLPVLQIQPRQLRLKLGGDAFLDSPRLADHAGDFRWGLYDATTRVDASSHCVSAVLMMQELDLLRDD